MKRITSFIRNCFYDDPGVTILVGIGAGLILLIAALEAAAFIDDVMLPQDHSSAPEVCDNQLSADDYHVVDEAESFQGSLLITATIGVARGQDDCVSYRATITFEGCPQPHTEYKYIGPVEDTIKDANIPLDADSASYGVSPRQDFYVQVYEPGDDTDAMDVALVGNDISTELVEHGVCPEQPEA